MNICWAVQSIDYQGRTRAVSLRFPASAPVVFNTQMNTDIANINHAYINTLLAKFGVGAKPRARVPRLYALGYRTSVSASAPASLSTRIGIGIGIGIGVVVGGVVSGNGGGNGDIGTATGEGLGHKPLYTGI